jgi:HEAT repeat protein
MSNQEQPNPDLAQLIAQLLSGSQGNPDAECQAAIALGDVTDATQRGQAVNALLQVLANPSSHALIRTHSVESLGRLADPAAVPALRRALTDNYRLVRAYAIGPYATMGTTQDVVDTLLPIAENDPFYGVRAEANAALASKAAGQGDTATRQRVRDFLTQRRVIESARSEPGIERVVAEIDRGLQRLGS